MGSVFKALKERIKTTSIGVTIFKGKQGAQYALRTPGFSLTKKLKEGFIEIAVMEISDPLHP